jgi:S-DNA-T family DNA segregation ATPase FtsK/SpoIIIE
MKILNFINLKRIFGLISLLMGVFVVIAIFSYNQADPSFNKACDTNVTNLAGTYGAYIADPLLQLLGLSSYVLAIILIFWGIFDLLNKESKIWPIRIILMFGSLFLSTIIFSNIFAKNIFSFGYVGGVFFANIHNIFNHSLYLKICILLFIPIFLLTIEIKIHYLVSLLKLLFITLPKILLSRKKIIKDTINIKSELSIKEQIKASFTKTKDPVKPKVKIPILTSKFILPSISLLAQVNNKVKKDEVSASFLAQNSQRLIKVLEDFGVYGKIMAAHPGPVVTLYELEPAAGTKSSRVIGLADDIARSISAISSRIAVVPGKNIIGIELPNENREMVYLRELIDSQKYHHSDYKLPIVLGKDIGGRSVIVDLTKMPHLLIAGTTGSGKSVAINTLILSLLYKLSPAQCRFIMIDPKMLELSVYDGIPHLLAPVVTEPKKAVAALNWVVKEMENRYKLMSQLGVRNIAGYNEKISLAKAGGETLERNVQTGFDPATGKPILEKIPFPMDELSLIVVIVDEMADLMLVAGKDIETLIQRLSQMARAAGIHLIMATQRPSVDVITGVIKANFPTRISFQVISRIDSRTILGEQGGAEQLLGMGDMLYMSSGSKIIRVHGPFVSDSEVEKIVSHLKDQGTPDYIEDITFDPESDEDSSKFPDGAKDDLYSQAVDIVRNEKRVSTSYIQRCLKIGYNRAATIIERMEKEGIISAANHAGKREILL